jgi:hypothetical protein
VLTLVGKDLPRPWNKGLLVGQKKPLQSKHVWSIRVRLEISRKWRDLALFNLAIDSKLRACDLVRHAVIANVDVLGGLTWALKYSPATAPSEEISSTSKSIP